MAEHSVHSIKVNILIILNILIKLNQLNQPSNGFCGDCLQKPYQKLYQFHVGIFYHRCSVQRSSFSHLIWSSCGHLLIENSSMILFFLQRSPNVPHLWSPTVPPMILFYDLPWSSIQISAASTKRLQFRVSIWLQSNQIFWTIFETIKHISWNNSLAPFRLEQREVILQLSRLFICLYRNLFYKSFIRLI